MGAVGDLGGEVDQVHGLFVEVLEHGFEALAHPTVIPLHIQGPTPYPLDPLRNKSTPVHLTDGNLRSLDVEKAA